MGQLEGTISRMIPSEEQILELQSGVYLWPKMEDVQSYVKTCHVCQMDQTEHKEDVCWTAMVICLNELNFWIS